MKRSKEKSKSSLKKRIGGKMKKQLIIMSSLLILISMVNGLYSIPISDGFDYPVGISGYATQNNDGDGWYNAQDYLAYYGGYGYHLGEDWNGEGGGNTDFGQPVYSSSNGTVVYRGNGGTGWGNVIIVRHQLSSGILIETLYAHLNTMSVSNGQDVNRRTQIGTIGDAGGTYYAHLHFELRYSNCTSWGSPGSGYSSNPSPTGWTDPSNFIDNNRPPVISLTQNLGIYATRTNPATIYSLPNEYGGSVPTNDINTYYCYRIANTGTTGVTLEDTGVNYYNASGYLFRVALAQSVYLAPDGGNSYREQRVYITDQYTSNQTTTLTGKVAYKISGVWYELSGPGSFASFTVYPRPTLSNGKLIKRPSAANIYYYQYGYKWNISSENYASMLSTNWNTEYYVYPNNTVSGLSNPLTPSNNSTTPVFVGRNLIYKKTSNPDCYLIDSDPSNGGSLRSRRFQNEQSYYNYGYPDGSLASQSINVSNSAYSSIMSEYPLGSEIGDNLTVSPTNINVGYQAGSTSFSITSNINWSVSENLNWLSVNPTNGTGNGTVTINYDANPTTTSRSGQITISGSGLTQTVTVVQASAPAALTVTPDNQNVGYEAGSTIFTITSNINWSVSDNAGWLTTSPPSGSNNGTITATYEQNNTTSERVATITISGNGQTETVTVTQAPHPYELSVTPENQNVGYEAGSTTFTITSNINWTVSDNADWLTVSPVSGSNNGTITVTYGQNNTTSERTATITISGNGVTDIVTLTQAAGTAVNDEIIPQITQLYQNFPNPFNPKTTIKYDLSESGTVRIEVLNCKGQIVKTLLNQSKNAGHYSIVWYGKDNSGKEVSSGLYLYKLIVNNRTIAMNKCLLLK